MPDEIFDCLDEAPEEVSGEVVEVAGQVFGEKSWDWEKWITERWSFESSLVFDQFRQEHANEPEAIAWSKDYEKWVDSMRLSAGRRSAGTLSDMFQEDLRFADSFINYLMDHMRLAEGDYDRQQYAKLAIEAMKCRSKLRPAFPAMRLDANNGGYGVS